MQADAKNPNAAYEKGTIEPMQQNVDNELKALDNHIAQDEHIPAPAL